MMLFFGICFVLYFLILLKGCGFCTIRTGVPVSGLSKQAGGRRCSGGWDEVYDRLLSLKYTGQTSLYLNDSRIVHCNQ